MAWVVPPAAEVGVPAWVVTTASFVLPTRGQLVSGDRVVVRRFGQDAVVAILLDVAGHGARAAEQADCLVQLLGRLPDAAPAAWLGRLHTELKGSFGAVAAAIRMDIRTGELEALSVGDVAMFAIPSRPDMLFNAPGLLGIAMPSGQSTAQRLTEPVRLVVVSDGVKSVGLAQALQMGHLSAADLAEAVVLQNARPHDDAACLVIDIDLHGRR